MDAIKILAAVVFKLRDEQGEIHLTLADLNACLVADATNIHVRQADDGLHLTTITTAEAKAEQRADEIKRQSRHAGLFR